MRRMLLRNFLARRPGCRLRQAKKAVGMTRPIKRNVRPEEPPFSPGPRKQQQDVSGKTPAAFQSLKVAGVMLTTAA